jgi:hypothetical protein
VSKLTKWYARRARFLFVERGLRGGNRTWLVLGGAFVAQRMVKKTFGRVPEMLVLDELKPGESITITTARVPTRKERKAAKHG